MFFGAHLILFSRNPDADRAFLRDVLEVHAVDAGEGWLIFRLPPAELGVHPAEAPPAAGEDGIAAASLYLMCRDLPAAMSRLADRGAPCAEPYHAGWGSVTSFALPGGSRIGLYQPRHPLAIEAADS